jgi:hypothetical protein
LLENLSIDIEVFLLNKVWLFAVVNPGFWLLCPYTICRVEKSWLEAFRAENLGGGLERIALNEDFAIDILRSVCLDNVWDLDRIDGIIVVFVGVWIGCFRLLIDNNCSRIGSSDLLVSVSFET